MVPNPQRPAWFLMTQHWVSLLGAAMVTTAVLSWLFVLPQEVRAHGANPYVGIVIFLLLPAVFFAGLALIPLGIYLARRKIRSGMAAAPFDRKSALRRLAVFLGVTTFANILIGTQFTYRGVKYMETPNFCGSCHVMAPEFTAYQNSPHSRVECVECHVAPGARGWIHSKTNGMRQFVETVFDTYRRPIPSAMETNRLVPASETCENCHWPQKFSGTRLRVFLNYAEDETSSRTATVLLMLIGGQQWTGIHGAHLAPGVHIRFAAADPARQTIPWVEYRNSATGELRRFVGSGAQPNAGDPLPEYEMQCVDCHNRPTHAFDMPDAAVDKDMAGGDIPVSLPFVKKESVELLKQNYSSREQAARELPPRMTAFYTQNYADIASQRAQDIRQASLAVLDIYNRNIFPSLKVTWGTYPNNLGHTDFPGCFRCHDGSHESKDGKTITNECTACHQPLAIDEASPEILKTLGIEERTYSAQKQ